MAILWHFEKLVFQINGWKFGNLFFLKIFPMTSALHCDALRDRKSILF